MSLAFAGLKADQAFLYMDDIIVIGHSESHHLENLKCIFERCRKRNLKLNPEKCKFFKHEVIFLGHKCTSEGLLPDDTKTEAMKKFPTPKDKDETRRFTACANYYRRFIQNFATIVAPLNKLTRKSVDFVWSDECEISFQKIKNALASPPILQFPDFSKQFIVTVDASQMACGAVLSQNINNNDLPICYISRSFQKGELNKPIIEKELLAIHFAVTYLRPYLYGTKFIVNSDHKPLVYLYNMKKPSSKLTRIRLDLEEYDFEIKHIKGVDNVVADALSRITIHDLKEIYQNNVTMLPVFTRSKTRILNQNIKEKEIENQSKEIANKLRVIEELNSNYDKKIPRVRCENEKLLCAFLKKKKIIRINLEEFTVNGKLALEPILSKIEKDADSLNYLKIQWPLNDILFKHVSIVNFKEACEKVLKKLQIILINPPITVKNKDEKLDILKNFHSDPLYGGHCGQKKMYANIRSKYFWKFMSKDVAKYVKQCQNCMVNKPKPLSKSPMQLTKTPQKPFDIVIVDTIGPLTRSDNGNVYILTIMCDLSKYLIAVAIPNKLANTIAKAIFNKFILTYGTMKEMRCDCGTEFKNEIVKELCNIMKINQIFSTAYRHQTLGTVERNHRNFNEYLRAYVSEIANWEEYLNLFVFCYNISNHSSLDDKFSPFELIFSKKCNMPYELVNNTVEPIYNFENFAKESKFRLQHAHKIAQKLLEKSKLNNKKEYDKNSKQITYNIDELVLLKVEPYNKFKPIFSGPHRIIKISEPNIEVYDNETNKRITVHKDRLRKVCMTR